MEELIYFIVSFLLIYIIYYFASIKKAKKDIDKLPVEVKYLVTCYHINLKKINYCKFLNNIAIVASFDIATTVTLVNFFQGATWQLLFGFVFVVPIIIFSFMAIGKYYQTHQDIIMEKERLKKKNKIKKKEKEKDGRNK